MNTNNIKKYAPKARREFMDAVAKRLNTFGITANKKGELQIAEANLQGSVLQIAGNSFDGKLAEPRKRIVARSQKLGYAQLIEQVAYTWFNRLCAIRYMEIHDYLGHGFRVLSHPDNPKGFEIIDHAQDAADELGLDRARIIELKLAGNKDEELYRELLLGQCHKLHEAMPFLFDALDDETELLLPDNLTRTDSILRGLADGIPEEDWQQVEVIGWLYQFYISEKKDQVMGKVVKSEDIPAATQLFTPNWIVKYLVQNSVGRQWLQTYPDSAIKTQMEYYIEPAEQSDEVNQQLKAITPESIEPETIKVLDPACGSGHILIEAYNVLKAIYEERGFRSRDIPKMILENNLYGLDIDDRAAQLSGFALMMMARDDDKRIFTRNVRLNVLSLQESNHIDLPTLWKALNLSGSWQSGTSQGLFSDDEQDLSSFNADNRYQLLKRTLARFTQAKTFGSLIDVPSDDYEHLKELLSTLVELQESGDSMQKPAAKELIEFVHQALILSIKYDVVVANPPYMGSKLMNQSLKDFASKTYPDSKNDLYALFIAKSFNILKRRGFNAQVTMQSWMYLGSYESFRKNVVLENTIVDVLHLGPNAFENIDGERVQVTASIFIKEECADFIPKFHRLIDFSCEEKQVNFKRDEVCFSLSKILDFKNLPDYSIAYKLNPSSEYYKSIVEGNLENVETKIGCQPGSDLIFYWWEVSDNKDVFVPYNKGGEYRKWYGNQYWVLKYGIDGDAVKNNNGSLSNDAYYFNEHISFTRVSSRLNMRYYDSSFIFDNTSPAVFGNLKYLLGFYNSKVGEYLRKTKYSGTKIEAGHVSQLSPIKLRESSMVISTVEELISLLKEDWDSQELSNNFVAPEILLFPDLRQSYEDVKNKWLNAASKVKSYEELLNYKFSEAYGLEEEVDCRVELSEISMKRNVFFNYRKEPDLVAENKQLSDYAIEIISFFVGLLSGRYPIESIDLQFKGEFNPDEDGIIPVTDFEWFKDDAANGVKEIIQLISRDISFEENLGFIAESLCLNAIKSKKSESALETIRRYLSTQFYKDHLKTYKKRPIYWLFSSGKQKAFECLVYLHRYNEGTLSRMRTEYVTPLLGKYDAYAEQLEKQIETSDSTSEANRFKKELDALIKKQVELREFDDKLKHYADMRISLDLDDGVKVNYGKFGDLLAEVKAITGSAPEVN
ncbi:BREX-1 system adenine-specific DNA-methyltransferase PglX [Vibrio cholerae]